MKLNVDKYLQEYSSEKAVRMYTKGTAGFGIGHLLEHDYGKIYQEVVDEYLFMNKNRNAMKILEFGCGGGMNLIHLILMLERQGINLHSAFGTDFSEKLIDAARIEAKKYLLEDQQKKVTFCVARNENLIQNLASQLNVDKKYLLESFDLILGVNTSRYCHRLNKEMEYVKNIEDLLTKGGICIIIDMNNRFPFFRSRIRLHSSKKGSREYYLPSLEEYARPFLKRGFEILKMKNFCWIPHSAGPNLTRICKVLTPVLNALASGCAMRSLVIARKT